MTPMTWLRLHPDKLLAEMFDLTPTERGAYIVLCCVAWIRGNLPKDAAKLAAIAGGKVSDAVMGKLCDAQNEQGAAGFSVAWVDAARAESADYSKKQSARRKRTTVVKPRSNRGSTIESGTVVDSGSTGHQPESAHDATAVQPSTSSLNRNSEKNITLSPKPPLGASDSEGGYSQDFETFWQAYPRHEGKRNAYKAWQAAVKRGTCESIMAGLSTSPRVLKTGADAQYIPHAATWLNGDGWLDAGPSDTGDPDQWLVEPDAPIAPSPAPGVTP